MSAHNRLGRYEVHEELGHGGFAIVFRAQDTQLGRDVALKIFDPILTRDNEWARKFQQEGRTMARLTHPHIVTIYDAGEFEGRLYVAMQLVNGPNLAQHLAQQGRLTWAETVQLLTQIADGLAYAHETGLVHRDLKPANVLLDPRQGALLSDFGFAQIISQNSYSLSVSMSGGLIGTPNYMAPEVWDEKSPGAPADIYALGCMLYEMVTGEKLFTGDSIPGIMRAHFRDLTLPDQWPADVPAGFNQVLQRALAKDPADRYSTVQALLADVKRLSEDTLAQPYAQLQAALADRQWIEAVQLALDIRAQNRDYRDVAALEEQALRGQQQAIQQARAAEWQAEAERALAEGHVKAARLAAQQWQKLAPDEDTPRLFLKKLAQRSEPKPAPSPATPASTTPPTTGGGTTWVGGVVGVILVLLLGLFFVLARGQNEEVAAVTPIPVLRADNMRTAPTDGMAQVYVPAGEFTMGSEDVIDDEKPVHTMYLDAYWLDQTEVTNAQFAQFVAATSYETTAEQEGGGYTWTIDGWNYTEGANWQRLQGPGSNLNGLDDHPVVLVSWHDAAAYCEWAGRRLPTEAEWEKAARGTDERTYPWGNQFDCSRGNFDDETVIDDYVVPGGSGCDGYDQASPVGSFPTGASPYGALDMAGNVWEWVADWYDGGYYARSPARNPPGPTAGDYTVLRGGSWGDNGNFVRAANRSSDDPSNRNADVGFRCAQE